LDVLGGQVDQLEVSSSDPAKERSLGVRAKVAVEHVADLGEYGGRQYQPAVGETKSRQELYAGVVINLGSDCGSNQRTRVVEDHASVPAEALGQNLIDTSGIVGAVVPGRSHRDPGEWLVELAWRLVSTTAGVGEQAGDLVVRQRVDELVELCAVNAHGVQSRSDPRQLAEVHARVGRLVDRTRCYLAVALLLGCAERR